MAHVPLAPAQVGEWWRFRAWVRTTADYNGTGGNGKLRIADQAGGLLDAVTWPNTNGVWQLVEREYQIRAGTSAITATYGADHTVGTLWLDDLEVTNITEIKAARAAADNLPKVLHGTTAPSGTAPNGSIWWQHLNDLRGVVIGQWNRVDGAWVSTPIDSQAIANLDVGKLTAGSGTIVDLVAQKIAASTAAIQKADIGNLTVTGSSKLADAVAIRMSADIGSFLKLYANQVIIGSGGNMLPDPNFIDRGGWEDVGGVYTYSCTGGRTGGGSLTIAATATEVGRYYAVGTSHQEKRPAVTPGSSIRVSAWVRSDAVIPVHGVSVFVRGYTAGNGLTWPEPSNVKNSEAIPANTWTRVSGIVKMPEDAFTATLGLYVNAHANVAVTFSEPAMQPATDGALVALESITAPHIVASQEMSAKIGQFLKVKTDMLEANAVTSDKLYVGAVNAKHVAIGSLPMKAFQVGVEEYVPNPIWMDADMRAVYPEVGIPNWYWDTNSSNMRFGQTMALTVRHDGGGAYQVSGDFPVAAGEKFHLGLWARNVSANFSIRFEMRVFDADGNRLNTGPGTRHVDTPSSGNGNHDLFAITVMPDGATHASLWLWKTASAGTAGWYLVNKISCRRILANRNGTSGPGIELSPSEIRAWNTAGTNTFHLTSNGDVYMIGTLQAGTEVVSPLMTGGTWRTRDSAGTYGGVQVDTTYGMRQWNSSGQLEVQIGTSGANLISGELRTAARGKQGLVLLNTTTEGAPAIFFSPNGSVSGSTSAIYIDNSNDINLRSKGGLPGNIIVRSDLVLSIGQIFVQNMSETSNAPNLYATPGAGRIYRSTSSRRYKTRIEDWKFDDPYRVLGLRERVWEELNPTNPEKPHHKNYGWIAEEAYEVLPEMVDLDAYGRPESLTERQPLAALIVAVRALKAEVDELKGIINGNAE